MCQFANAQERTKAVGVRVSFVQDEYSLVGTEFSFQKDVRKIGRRETDIGWWASGQWDILKFTLVRQWKIVNTDRFNFYGGGGFGVGYIIYNFGQNEFFATLGLNLGVDYTFGFPIQIAIDTRPEWTIVNNFGTNLGYDVALAVRLAF